MTTPYEVRCPRCDVSFPVETKRCMHCGGPTVWPDQVEMVMAEPFGAPDDAPLEYFPDSTASVPESVEDQFEAPEEPKSTGRSLLRSLGGFVWIIVLIGFTLARNCGEE